MKCRKWLVCLFLLLPSPLAAQGLPDRQAHVFAIASQHPETFTAPTPEEADRRKLALLPTIVRALNSLDGGLWGLLRKNDQGGRIPADIIVWRPTLQTVDVLSDTGPMWGVQCCIDGTRWQWLAVEGSTTPEQPPPPIPTPTPQPVPLNLEPVLTLLRESRETSERQFLNLTARDDRTTMQLQTISAQLDTINTRLTAIEEKTSVLGHIGNFLKDPKTLIAVGSAVVTWITRAQVTN